MNPNPQTPALLLQAIIRALEEEDGNRSGFRSGSCRGDHSVLDLDEEQIMMMGKRNRKPAKALKPETLVNTISLSQTLSERFASLPQLQKYALSTRDVTVIARLWKEMAGSKCAYCDWSEALEWVQTSGSEPVQNLELLGSLLQRNIIFNREEDCCDHSINPYTLMQARLTLHSGFRYDLLPFSLPEKLEAMLSPVWNERSVMDRDLLLARCTVMDTCPEIAGDDASSHFYHRAFLTECFQPLWKRLQSAGPDLPLVKLIREQQPDETDLLILIWTYTDYLQLEHSPLPRLANIVSSSYEDRLLKTVYLKSSPSLKALGLRVESRFVYGAGGHLGFNDASAQALGFKSERAMFEDEDEDDGPGSQALIELKASQSFGDLILPEQDKNLLAAAVKRWFQDGEVDLADWGVYLPMSPDSDHSGKGTCILLYGEPGTGKTFCAGAIATELGKKLLSIDASRLRNKYFGESEKLLRGIFAQMREIVNSQANPPVFLLNEADQIVHKRVSLENSCASVENAIQNIFLEELGTFGGILVLTTNLVENIDEAYFRRFDIKIELHRPDEACRVQLWKLHLPSTIPGADEIDIACLASAFTLTGGQISLVVRNACAEAITRPGSLKRLTMEDLVRYARLEDPWGGPGEGKKTIGF